MWKKFEQNWDELSTDFEVWSPGGKMTYNVIFSGARQSHDHHTLTIWL